MADHSKTTWLDWPEAPAHSGACSTLRSEHFDWGRMAVELLFYLSIGARIFAHQLGILKFTGLSGAMVLGSGIACLTIMICRRETFPPSIYFAVVINVFAHITDLFVDDQLNRDMLFWLSALLMTSYILKDKEAMSRLVVFIGGCVLGALAIDATFATERVGIDRLYLQTDSAGSMFANANDLAQIACVTAIIAFFQAPERPLPLKITLYSLALSLATVTLLTLSRQGLLMLGIGLTGYLFALLSARNRLLDFLLITGAIGAFFYFYGIDQLSDVIRGYEFRFSQSSGRIDYWQTAPRDMSSSIVAGFGSDNAYSYDGSLPHSTFLWLHLAFGGVCAWIYALWIAHLGWRTVRLGGDKYLPWLIRIEAVIVFTVFALAQFTTVFAPGNYAFVLSVALLESRFGAVSAKA